MRNTVSNKKIIHNSEIKLQLYKRLYVFEALQIHYLVTAMIRVYRTQYLYIFLLFSDSQWLVVIQALLNARYTPSLRMPPPSMFWIWTTGPGAAEMFMLCPYSANDFYSSNKETANEVERIQKCAHWVVFIIFEYFWMPKNVKCQKVG